ncbi:SIMPL domain-containing protein, partial [Streptomyces sp. NPDC000941]
AREYAGALDARLTALVELADLDSENANQPYPVAYAAARSAGYGGAPQEAAPALDLEPQRQTVYAQVNARFTMSPPQL